MRLNLTALFACLILPAATFAGEAGSGQISIDQSKVLRGHFVEEKQMEGSTTPLQTSGHFAVTPANGLIWGIEQPFPTTTVITPNGAIQAMGGISLKLPTKNLRHLYDMVGGALAGNWSELEKDFVLTRTGTPAHWLITLTPRPEGNAKLPYSSITVGGSSFVENITMLKADGGSDTLNFTDEILSPLPLTAKEDKFFAQASRQAE